MTGEFSFKEYVIRYSDGSFHLENGFSVPLKDATIYPCFEFAKTQAHSLKERVLICLVENGIIVEYIPLEEPSFLNSIKNKIKNLSNKHYDGWTISTFFFYFGIILIINLGLLWFFFLKN